MDKMKIAKENLEDEYLRLKINMGDRGVFLAGWFVKPEAQKDYMIPEIIGDGFVAFYDKQDDSVHLINKSHIVDVWRR